MSTSRIDRIQSRDNAWLKQLRRVAQDGSAYRRAGQVWLEGEHLCRAALARGVQPGAAVFTESAWARDAGQWPQDLARIVVLPDVLFAGISALESPASMGFVLALPADSAIDPHAPSVVLDRLQDAGNVGAILRCASAFGFRQVIAIKGTAALWSPKVLRAGMGAHFGLTLVEAAAPEGLAGLSVPLLVTSSHRGEYLHQLRLPWPCAWVFGHEGQGVSAELESRASASVRIVQPGGEESLNVATAAAICMHASAAANAGQR